MVNSSDPARRRRSASDVVSLVRAATAPIRQSLAVSFSALGGNAQAAFVRYFDSGYDPSASNRHSRRGEEGIAVRNLSVCYGKRYAFEGLTGEFAPASLTAVIGPNGAGKSSLLKAACRDYSACRRRGDLRRARAPSTGVSAAAGRTRPRVSDHGRRTRCTRRLAKFRFGPRASATPRRECLRGACGRRPLDRHRSADRRTFRRSIGPKTDIGSQLHFGA
jgi:hypothetical protein